jgi:hypothetical protein
MASAAGVAGFRASLDLGSKSSKRVQCGESDSARTTGNPEVMPLDQYRETPMRPPIRPELPCGRKRGAMPTCQDKSPDQSIANPLHAMR